MLPDRFPIFLLQQDLDGYKVVRLILAGALILLVAGVGYLLVMRLRRHLQEPDQPASAGFSLSDLRQLHKSGQMTTEEFDKAKTMVLEAARKAAERDEARTRRQGEAKNGGTSDRF